MRIKTNRIVIRVTIIGTVLSILASLGIYFSKNLGNLVFILLGLNFIGFFVGYIIMKSKRVKSEIFNQKERFSLKEIGITIIIITTLSCIPTSAAFINKVITTANREDLSNIGNDKKEILFNLNKELFMKRLEAYYFVVNDLDFSEFTFVKKDNINFYYENEKCFDSIKTIEELIKVKGKDFEKIFELEKVDNIKIGVADKMIFKRTIASYFNYNDTMMISSSNTLDDLKKKYEEKGQILENTFEESILHEYVHLLLKRAADERGINFSDLPNWLIEGTATYVYKNSVGVEMPDFTDKKVNIKNDKNFKGKNAAKYYNQSMYLVKYLFDKHGDQVVVDVLDDMAKGNDIYKSIENVVGESFEELNSKY
ncbi:MAG: hypothetical protein ACRC68_11900 [Clostridium sp.]